MDWISEHPGWFTLILSVAALIFFAGRWVGGMNDFKTTVGNAIVEIKNSIETIQGDIKSILRALPANTIETESPIRLNDLGRQVSLELQAVSWAEGKADNLLGKVRGLTNYQIQEHCFKYAHDEYGDNEDWKRRAEDSAYKHDLNIDQVLRVAGVELRDILLKRLNLDVPD